MEKLDKTVKLIRRIYSKNGCVLHQKVSVNEHLKTLESEIEELKQGLSKKDWPNVQEELGDILWDAIALSIIAEKENLTTFSRVLKQLNRKVVFRNPHVFGKRKTRNEEMVREIRAKAKADYKLWMKRHFRKKKKK
ncbi:MAG: MazG nucleotide pyrophosphohydrolase domain-containing protein [Candidatus Micrarchaeota archaeon]